jgi:hypothetical protein
VDAGAPAAFVAREDPTQPVPARSFPYLPDVSSTSATSLDQRGRTSQPAPQSVAATTVVGRSPPCRSPGTGKI